MCIRSDGTLFSVFYSCSAENPAWYYRHQIGQIERLPSWEEWSLLPREAQSIPGSWLIHVASFTQAFRCPVVEPALQPLLQTHCIFEATSARFIGLLSLLLSLLNSCMTSALVSDLSGAGKWVKKLLGHGAVCDKSRNSAFKTYLLKIS